MPAKPLLLSVCASPELGELLGSVSRKQSLRVAKINQYLTPNSRFDCSQFPPNTPLIAFVDFTSDPEQGIKTAEVFSNISSPRIWTVAVSEALDPDLMLRAMSAGCSEYIGLPSGEANVEQAMNNILRRAARLDSDLKTSGKVVAFVGVRGGTGATTLAVHTALGCATGADPRNVLLVDLKRQLGHVAVYLNIDNPGYTFSTALQNVDRLDSELLQTMLVRHSPNLAVLPSSDDCMALTNGLARQPYSATTTSEEAIDRVLDQFRSDHELTIFDADPQLPETVAIARRADHVFVVVSLDIGSVRDVARYMDSVGRDVERQRLIVTRVGNSALSPDMLKNAAGIPVVACFPDLSEPISSAINTGTPIPRQVRGFYDQLAPVLREIGMADAPGPRKQSIFRWRKS
jgi:pilus assembly protein CpaE